MAIALTAGQIRIMHPVKWSRYVFQCGQRVKTQNLTGQDLDPGHGWEYSRLCSVPPLDFVLKGHVGSSNLVRCPESRSVRFSEVRLALQLL